MKGIREVELLVDGRKIALPVLDVFLWEDADEEGFTVDEGYVYLTPFGRVVTRMTPEGEKVLYSEMKEV